MRTWTRAQFDTTCGRCRRSLSRGDPMQLITLSTLKRALVRCAACVGPAPPDLPTLVERAPVILQSWTRVQPGLLPADWKHAQAGEREVGEEG